MSGNKKITIKAVINTYTAHGRLGIDLAFGFLENGIDVAIVPITYDKKYGEEYPLELQEKITTREHASNAEIFVHSPHISGSHLFSENGKKRILFSAWETTKLIPRVASSINSVFDEVIVPSRFCADAFASGGVNLPITVIPHGVDEGWFFPDKNNDGNYFPVKSHCVFGCAARMAHGGVRKGLPRIFEAFKEAFPYDSDVELRVKCFPDCELPPEFDNRIHIHRGYLNHGELRDWYRSLSAFVTVSTEGWGFHQHEAQLCGKALVGLNWSGVNEFFHGYSVSYDLAQALDIEYYGEGLFALVEKASLVKQLRYVRRNPIELFLKGQEARKKALKFTKQRMIDEFCQFFENRNLV